MKKAADSLRKAIIDTPVIKDGEAIFPITRAQMGTKDQLSKQAESVIQNIASTLYKTFGLEEYSASKLRGSNAFLVQALDLAFSEHKCFLRIANNYVSSRIRPLHETIIQPFFTRDITVGPTEDGGEEFSLRIELMMNAKDNIVKRIRPEKADALRDVMDEKQQRAGLNFFDDSYGNYIIINENNQKKAIVVDGDATSIRNIKRYTAYLESKPAFCAYIMHSEGLKDLRGCVPQTYQDSANLPAMPEQMVR